MNMISSNYSLGIDDLCSVVIKEARNSWRMREVVVDDITAVVIRFE